MSKFFPNGDGSGNCIMFNLLCAVGFHVWFFYGEANLSENVRVYKKCERSQKKLQINNRRRELRDKQAA